MDPILQVEKLEKKFGGVVAVDGINFEVNSHQIKAIIGPNGAGKTTIFNLICGIY
ncbi:MAG: ATP-binding cassette domain-containing protein, partial [bacterium]